MEQALRLTMPKYTFGIPGWIIWGVHVGIGLFLLYLGYVMQTGKRIPQWSPILLMVLGAIVVVYHVHLWYNWYKQRQATQARLIIK